MTASEVNPSCAYQSLFVYLFACCQKNEDPEQATAGITKWYDHHVSSRADYFHKGCGHFTLKGMIISTSKLEHKLKHGTTLRRKVDSILGMKERLKG